MVALGTKVSKTHKGFKSLTEGVPPVILQAQPNGYIVLETPEELRQWEADVKKFYGISVDSSKVLACETCSCGCSDDCGVRAE